MPARPFAWAARCFCRLRHLRTASSSRQNCSETNLPAVVMLSKRSSEMNPSAFSRSAFSPATRSMYSGNLPSAGVNSKMTAIIGPPGANYSSLSLTIQTACASLGRRGPRYDAAMIRSFAAPTAGLALLLASWACGATEYDCMIEARQTVEIRSTVEAVIESVKVTRGSFVAKGQVIVTLESGPERAALALAQGRAETQGDIKVSEARVGITRKKWQRAEELFKQNFIS